MVRGTVSVVIPVYRNEEHLDELCRRLSETLRTAGRSFEIALIDGIRGAQDWRTGAWQGYVGTDVLATVDLGSMKMLKHLGLGVLQDQRSWIWYPESVQFAWSMNGHDWSSATVVNKVPRTAEGTQTMDMTTELLNKHAHYIKVIAKNAGPCPDWHPGKGDASYIFTDELLIDCE